MDENKWTDASKPLKIVQNYLFYIKKIIRVTILKARNKMTGITRAEESQFFKKIE